VGTLEVGWWHWCTDPKKSKCSLGRIAVRQEWGAPNSSEICDCSGSVRRLLIHNSQNPVSSSDHPRGSGGSGSRFIMACAALVRLKLSSVCRYRRSMSTALVSNTVAVRASLDVAPAGALSIPSKKKCEAFHYGLYAEKQCCQLSLRCKADVQERSWLSWEFVGACSCISSVCNDLLSYIVKTKLPIIRWETHTPRCGAALTTPLSRDCLALMTFLWVTCGALEDDAIITVSVIDPCYNIVCWMGSFWLSGRKDPRASRKRSRLQDQGSLVHLGARKAQSIYFNLGCHALWVGIACR
jgi:hypothetical protein